MALNERYHNPLLGRDFISVTVTPLTVDADGDPTAGTTVNCSGQVQRLANGLTTTHENITSINSPLANPVPVEDSGAWTLEIYKVNDGTSPSKLREIFLSHKYFLLVWIEGTGGSAMRHTAYVTRGANSGDYQGKGQQNESQEFLLADFGPNSYTVEPV